MADTNEETDRYEKTGTGEKLGALKKTVARIPTGKQDRTAKPADDALPGPDLNAILETALDRRIAEMRALFDRMRPASGAEALKTLRDRYPDLPLSTRMAAVARLRSE